MRLLDLQKTEKLYFSAQDLARTLGISFQSAQVSASRYVKLGVLLRLRPNVYVLGEKWLNLDREQQFAAANLIQTPSYVSLMTALDYYEITTQVQQNFVESVALRRTKEVAIASRYFTYTKIKPDVYGGFSRLAGCFIASPEKAFLDAAYLASLGRYSFDLPSIDLNKLDAKKIEVTARAFPPTIKGYLRKRMNLAA